MTSLAEQIRTARKSKGWTQTDLGKRVGVPLTTLAGWEQGKSTPKIPSMVILEKVLGIKIEALADAQEDLLRKFKPAEKITRPWDRERIKYELRLKGYTLASLTRIHDYSIGYFAKSLSQPLRHAEKIIAEILEVHPSEIWPQRYGPDGQPHQGRLLDKDDARLQSHGPRYSSRIAT